MLKFFVPFATDPREAESVYQTFVANSQGSPSGYQRLYSVVYEHNGKRYSATVGEEISGWPERVGPVLGIVEKPNILCIHTQLRGGLSATPLYASPESARERVYFDDYPAQT